MPTDPTLAESLLEAFRPPGWDYELLPPIDVDATEQNAPPLDALLDGWEILDLDNATWAARHLARRRDKLAMIRALAEHERARVDAWETKEAARWEADCAFFLGRLEAFHRAALDADPRNAKTIRLPDGTELRSQAGKLAVEITDLEAFTAWVEKEGHEDLLRYKDPEVDKVAVTKQLTGKAAQESEPGRYTAVTDDGEPAPGIEIVRRERSYVVVPPEGSAK